MKTYRPGNPPSDPAQLPGFLRQELPKLQAAANRPEPYVEIEAMKTAPSKALFGIFGGAGAPTFSAGKGSLYLRTDGSSTSTRAYVNGDGGTTWIPITTAS